MSKGEKRPYLQSGVVELERLFADKGDDREVLEALSGELLYRDTERAKRLRAKIVVALSRQGASDEVVVIPNLITSQSNQAPREPAAPASPLPLQDLEEASPYVRPARQNDPSALLANWIALEALSPQTYRRPEDLANGERSRILDLKPERLPWQMGVKAIPNTKLYFTVVLGAINMDTATRRLIEAFGQDEERSRPERTKAAIASILVDRDGIPVEDGIAVSSFAWALPKALRGDLGRLGAWPRIESQVLERLRGLFVQVDKNGKTLPISFGHIEAAYKWLIENFKLSPDLLEPPSFAFKIFHWYKAPGPPDPLLLNSFFLNDLSRASDLVKSGAPPSALGAYLGIKRPEKRFNLSLSPEFVEETVAPKRFPSVRWPAPGGHPLVLLQQAAVNASQVELVGKQGLVAVNGPPGTGKTTLLRDVIAARVLDRATAMAAFDDPHQAFVSTGHKVSAGPAAFFQIYRLDESLKGQEIIVASSNNKAVENISRELPGLGAVGRNSETLNYFKSISDRLFDNAPDEMSGSEGGQGVQGERIETWGLIAAVLGNASNRAQFQKRFWWDAELGFRLYLKAAKGDSLVTETKDPKTGKITRHIPRIMDAEQPPSPDLAKRKWNSARTRFLELKASIEQDLGELEKVRSLCKALPELRRAKEEAERGLSKTKVELDNSNASASETESLRERDAEALASKIADRDAYLPLRPGFFSRLFRTARWKHWEAEYRQILDGIKTAQLLLKASDKDLQQSLQRRAACQKTYDAAYATAHKSKQTYDHVWQTIEQQRQVQGTLLDEAFASKSHEAQNIVAPWVSDALHKKREDLFIAALAVHRAFVEVSAQKVLHNLSVFFIDQSVVANDHERRKYIADLWSTLFLVIPVISTTFASVDRMIGHLPPESFGWLLIDEAGQATPQAAVGAIMRSKRVMIVGDPMQIPPVVSLPDRLNSEIAAYFAVTRTRWTAPDASAQTLADHASRFIGSFETDQGVRQVGVPLLVHRRCRNPMFAISNAIAYDGKMVFGTPERSLSAIRRHLGAAHWIDVDGEAETKWCPSEGNRLIEVLAGLADIGVVQPDIFIISPFRIVADELRRRLDRESDLLQRLGVSPREWLKDRVGTIHTFQGREADTVFLVLGAPNASQIGARAWAAGTPNIFNVAVTRAKENLYVIGSRAAWSGVGYARELANRLPVKP